MRYAATDCTVPSPYHVSSEDAGATEQQDQEPVAVAHPEEQHAASRARSNQSSPTLRPLASSSAATQAEHSRREVAGRQHRDHARAARLAAGDGEPGGVGVQVDRLEPAADQHADQGVTRLVDHGDAEPDPRPAGGQEHQHESQGAGGHDEAGVWDRLGRGRSIPDLAQHSTCPAREVFRRFAHPLHAHRGVAVAR